MAPEVVDAWVGDAFSYNKKCDVWSLGIIMYTMLCGYPPFYASCGRDCGWERGESCHLCQEMLFEKIQEGEFEFPEKEWAFISNSAKDLIAHMLVRDPTKRFTADQVLQHKWIQDPPQHMALDTPRVMSRNNSSQILDTYAENAMACTRRLVRQLTLTESCQSSGSTSSTSSNPFFSSASVSSAGSPEYLFGAFSEDEDEETEDQKFHCYVNDDKLKESRPSLRLSLPSSKLALKRQSRQI